MGIANINKKTIGKSILIITLILLLSSIAYAKPFTDAFRGGLLQINDFFAKEQYKPYSQVIDFFFFSLLFIAIYLMGVRYAFKEVKRPEQVIAILLGLMTAFLLVLGGFSLTILLPYMQWILYVLLFILYWWLLKGIKNKFWRFVLALLLTLLTIALFQGLFDSLTAPDAEGFFKSLGKGFGAIQFPELPGPPGVPSYLTDLFGAPTAAPTGPDLTTLPSTTTPASEAPGKGGIFGTGTSWWWVLLPLILALATGGGIFAHRKGWLKWPRRGERPAGEEPAAAQPTPPTTPEELTIQKIVDEMIEIIKIKQEILKVVDGIVRYKKAKIKDLHDEYMKVLKYDRSFWVDTESEAFQSFLAQQHVIKTILKLEFDLEKLLIQLMEKENQITGFGKYSNEAAMRIGAERRPIKVGLAGIWLRRVIELDRERARELIQELDRIEKEDPLLFWEKVRAKIEQWLISLRNAPYWYRELMAKIYGIFFRLFTKSHGTTLGLCWAVKQKIAEYFIIGKNERYKLKAWEKLTEIKTLQKWYRDKSKWKTIDKTNPEAIKRHFENEEKFFFEQLRPAILAQMKYMYLLTRYLKLFLANREKFTEMQELWLEFQDFISWYPRRLTKEEAANPENALLIGMPFTVKTKMARGVNGDYKALFYIDGQVVLDPNTGRPYEKTITKSDEIQFPDIELMSQEVTRYRTLLAGEHEATIYIIGPLDPNTGRPILEESPETPIAAKYRDVKSIKFWLIEPNVGIQITMPIEQSSHIIGRSINLRAELENQSINISPKAFKWYLEQESYFQEANPIWQIFVGPTGSSDPIDEVLFHPGEAILRVTLFKGTTQVGFKQIRIRLITPPRFRFNLAQTIQREITILQSILYWIRSRRGQRRRQQVPELAEDEDMEAEAVLSELQSFERDIEEYGEGRGSRNLMEHLWQRSKSIRDKLGRLLHLLAEYGNEQIKQETRKIITLDDIREFFLNLITGTKLESPTFRINLIKGLTPEEMRELIRRFREERGVTEEHEEIPGAPHPHDLTPTVEHPIVSEPQPFLDVITFLNDLYTALRQKMWGRVSSLLGFALNQNRLGQKILEVGQISFLRNLSDSLESTNFQRAGDILNSANAREIFRQNPQILEELKRIVEEIRRESEGEEPSGPAPPASPVPPSAPTTGGAERLRRMADRLRGRRPPA